MAAFLNGVTAGGWTYTVAFLDLSRAPGRHHPFCCEGSRSHTHLPYAGRMAKPRMLTRDEVTVYLTALQQHLNAVQAEAQRLENSPSLGARSAAGILRDQVDGVRSGLARERERLYGMEQPLLNAQEDDLAWRKAHPVNTS